MATIYEMRNNHYNLDGEPSEISDGLIAISLRSPGEVCNEKCFIITRNDLKKFIEEIAGIPELHMRVAFGACP